MRWMTLLLLVSGAVCCGGQSPALADAPGKPVPRATPLKHYEDPAHGIRFAYPATWVPTAQTPSYLGQAFATETIQPVASFTFTGGGREYAKTVLQELVFSYFVMPASSAEACEQHARESTTGDAAPDSVHISGVPFLEFTGGSAGLCHEQASQIDVAYRNDQCIAFERDFNTECYGAGDGSRKLTAREETALQERLDAVLQSVRIAPAQIAAINPPPLATYSDPQTGVTFDYPAVWHRADPTASSPPFDYCEPAVFGTGKDSVPIRVAVQFTGDGNAYAKTELASLVFMYGTKKGITADACRAIANIGEDAKTDSIVIQGVSFAHGNGGECGLGHGVDANVYATYRDRSCYVFEEDFYTARPDDARDLTKTEMHALQRHLDGVMRTVRFGPGASSGPSGASNSPRP